MGLRSRLFMTCDDTQVYVCAPELWAYLAHLPADSSVPPGRCQSHSDFRESCITSPATSKGHKDLAHLALGKMLCCRSIHGEAILQRKPTQYLPDFHLPPFASFYYRHHLVTAIFSFFPSAKGHRVKSAVSHSNSLSLTESDNSLQNVSVSSPAAEWVCQSRGSNFSCHLT